ncbi:MAG: hypothetical protein LBU37_04100 [Tannerellaceae bacterium]|jgi:hypothetical protein|nr:hypothetical protein [Tannerellaceae bacterium]
MRLLLLFFLFTFSTSIIAQDYASERSKSCVIAENFVKRNLKYPKEASFSLLTTIHESIDYRKCTVLGKVTTKNAYGVKIEYIYKVWLEYLGGDWSDINNWKQLKIVFEEYK